MLRNTPIQKRKIHRVNVRVKNHVIEVPDDDCKRREHGLVKMDSLGNVDGPAGQEAEDSQLKPDHQASQAHDHRAP